MDLHGRRLLSIVAHEDDARLLHIRARIAGDVERLFPEADVMETPHGDYYRFRCSVSKERVADAVARRIRAIDYTSFAEAVESRTDLRPRLPGDAGRAVAAAQ